MKLQIRQAKKIDFEKIYQVFSQEYRKKPYNEKWDKKNGLRFVNNYSKIAKIFVAISDGKLIGAIIFRIKPDNKGFLLIVEELAVNIKFQGKGIGRKLMELAENYGLINGCHSVRLLTHNQSHAVKFYEKLNYEKAKDIIYF